MATFRDISNEFRQADKQLVRNVRSVLYEETQSLLSDFKARSPVDTSEYRSRWEVRQSRFTPANSLSSYTIFNETPYAEFMEFGAEIGAEPWYFTGKKRSGKLAIRNGRVWAGGLNPGHSKTVKGAIGPVLVNNNRRLNRLANKMADAIIGGFGGK